MNKLVSIIVPVYNVQAYLERCLTSLVNQTYENIEIIVINDGSTDQSLSICETYAAKYEKIKLINQKNMGLSGARNSGLKVANGEYIAFIDSDDYTSNDMIYHQVKALDEGFDMVEPIMKLVYDDKAEEDYNYVLPSNMEELELSNNLKNLFKIVVNVNGKMYRKEVIEGIAFPLNLVHEDVYYTTILLSRFKRIKKLKKGIFYYYMRSNSITGVVNNKIYDMFEIMKLIHDYYVVHHLNMQIPERIFVRGLLFAQVFKKYAYLKDTKMRNIKLLEIKAYFYNTYPNFLKNPYISLKEKAIVSLYFKFNSLLIKKWGKINNE